MTKNKNKVFLTMLLLLMCLCLTIQIIGCTNTPAYAYSEPTMPIPADRFTVVNKSSLGLFAFREDLLFVIKDNDTNREYVLYIFNGSPAICPLMQREAE